MTLLPVIYAAGTFVSTLLGGLFALRFSGWMDRIMAFSGGVLLAAGLLDLLPQALSLAAAAHPGPIQPETVYPPLLFVVAGFVIFYLIERMAILRSYHSHHHHPEQAHLHSPVDGGDLHHSHGAEKGNPSHRQVGILGAAGLCVHSLLDGFSIGVAFHANSSLGVLVAVAVIAHDFSDGVTTVALVLSGWNSRGASLVWLLIDAIAPLVGLGLASRLTLSTPHLGDLLGAFAGMFLYLGATHLLPEAHALSDSWKTVAWMLIGVGLMSFVTYWVR